MPLLGIHAGPAPDWPRVYVYIKLNDKLKLCPWNLPEGKAIEVTIHIKNELSIAWSLKTK